MIIIFTAAASYSQIPEVMVGDTEVIAIFPQPYNGAESVCNSQDFSLQRHLNSNFIYQTIKRWPGGDIQAYWGKADTAASFFAPRIVGIQNDSAIFWSWWHCTPPRHYFDFADSFSYQFTAKGIDSIVVIKIKDTTISLPIDTQAQKYTSKTEPFYFYSNIADSVLFDSWQLVIDSVAQISFTVDSNSNAMTEYLSKPFTRKKQLNFTFTTSLPATDTAQSFPAIMKTRVRYHGVDSIYSNNFTIILPAAPKSGVRSDIIQDISFTINPNPLSKLTTFIVSTANSEPIILEIYDILGNRKAVIANNEIINGAHSFSFDASGLASGWYFARLACGIQVVTRKLFIEK